MSPPVGRFLPPPVIETVVDCIRVGPGPAFVAEVPPVMVATVDGPVDPGVAFESVFAVLEFSDEAEESEVKMLVVIAVAIAVGSDAEGIALLVDGCPVNLGRADAVD